MRKKNIFLSIFLGILSPLLLSANDSLQHKIEKVLEDPALRGSTISVCVDNQEGQRLVNIHSDKLLIPSSNLKLITTGCALLHFGKNYNFNTQLTHDGEIQDSTLIGNVYIIGGADPTLGSSDQIATQETDLFERWRQSLLQAGIKKIEGRILGDGSYFDGMKESPLWQFDDIGTYYGSGTSGLQWHENYVSLKVNAGEFVGDSLRFELVGPQTPWIQYRLHCNTGERGTGDRLYLYTNDESENASLIGTFALGKPTKNLKVSNKFPERTCAYLFSEYLRNNGLENGGYGAFDRIEKAPIAKPENSRLLCISPSPSLWEIAKSCNTESNNIYAETFLRALGKDLRQSACYDSCYVALEQILQEIGIECRDSSGKKIDGIILDGSGLARHNLLSTSFMCKFLFAMTQTDCYKDYLSTIPQPGLQGTVRPCLRLLPSSERRRMRIKSGSMTGIQCYSGYALPHPRSENKQTLIFSLMINNTTADMYQLRKITDAILSAILEENK